MKSLRVVRLLAVVPKLAGIAESLWAVSSHRVRDVSLLAGLEGLGAAVLATLHWLGSVGAGFRRTRSKVGGCIR